MSKLDFVLPEPTRLHALTEKISTSFGSMYVHCHFDNLGRVHSVQVSYPGKHMEKEVGQALDAINVGFNGLIEAALNAAK